MNLHKSFEIPEDNPFLNDKFERKNFINNLMEVINAYDSGMVLSIDSSWGTGKTTFIKMWEAYLKDDKFKDKYEAIYFNAWENDDSIDPLVPLVNVMSERFLDEKGISDIETNLKKVGSMLVKKAVPFALRIATHGLINISDTDMQNFTQKQLEDYAGKVGETTFAEQKQKDEFKKEFKKILQEYQELMDKKVIIFIDELDRCRPLYAIEVLERVKHFFELDNFFLY
jgi:predicted KAP-like P-loop ATPase